MKQARATTNLKTRAKREKLPLAVPEAVAPEQSESVRADAPKPTARKDLAVGAQALLKALSHTSQEGKILG